MCNSSAELFVAIEALQAEVGSLSARLAKLEDRTAPAYVPVPKTNSLVQLRPPGQAEPISEETVLIISAAVAASLGERRHIRQIRLVSTHSWAAQGRVSIQASHRRHQ